MKRDYTNNEHHRLLAVSEPAKITMFSAGPRDGYEPLDEDSANLIKHRRNVKRGTAIVALAALLAVSTVGVVHVTEKNSNHSKSKSNASTKKEAAQLVDTDALFSYMLMDEKGYFFPTTLGSLKEGNADASQPSDRRNRRLLEENQNDLPPPQMNWSWDWKHDKEAGAAVAEYYRAKGMALADYYRSKYDPTYNQNVDSPSIPASDTTTPSAGTSTVLGTNPTTSDSVWTYDWQADQDRGIAIGETYKAIGESIEDHYRKAYDPTYQASLPTANVRSASPQKSSYYDWQADQERGLAIGEHYKNLGRKIQEHYDGDSYEKYMSAKGQMTQDDAKTMWDDFKRKGMEIGQYYHQKGLAIGDYYRNRAQWGTSPADISAALSLDMMADPVATAAVTSVPAGAAASPAGEINPANPAEAAAASAPAAAASAEVAAKNANLRGEAAVTSVLAPTTEVPAPPVVPVVSTATPPPTAQQIIDDMRRKGEAIGDYYRSKYDPTYHQNLGGTTAAASPLDDEQVWPAWGENSEADRAHGQAIGNYYRAKYDPTFQQQDVADQEDVDVAPFNGQEIGQFYEHKGKELGQYYQSKGMAIGDAYRSKYDPTFQAPPPQALDVSPQDANAPAVEKPLKEDWPAWGVDSDADKAHGRAIHEYYKQRGMEERRHHQHDDHHEHHDHHHHHKDQREDKEDDEEDPEQVEDSIQDFYREQGKEIRDYYRSKYDPTYRPAAVVPPTDERMDVKKKDGYVVDFDDDSAEATATATVTPQNVVAASAAPMTQPSWAPWMGDGKPRNEDWPAWGVNPEADRAHGKAIGAYYKKRGKDVGRHYENYYRTMFDPSYRGAQRDINW